MKPGDEIIVTNQDHEANISPWRRLKEKGAIIKEWSFDKKDGELKLDKLKKLLSKKTKIVAVTHCSNIVGSVNNLKLIASIVHKYKAILIGDYSLRKNAKDADTTRDSELDVPITSDKKRAF